jgi:hypothetical protein
VGRTVQVPRSYRVSLSLEINVGEPLPRKIGVSFEAHGPNLIAAIEDFDWEGLGLKERFKERFPELGDDVDPVVIVGIAGSASEVTE